MKGEAQTAKVHYKGSEEDFIVFVDSEPELKRWKEDSSVPLAGVVGAFKVFVTHGHGAQGQLDGASNQTLDNEFGTHDIDAVIKKILEQGDLQVGKMGPRQGDTNDSKGAGAGGN